MSIIVFGQENSWVLINNENGIKSYQLTGDPQNLDTYIATTELNCRLDVIAVILKDFPHYPEWMPDCIELHPIKSIDNNNMVLYYRHQTPWPARTRDAVLHVNTVLDTVKKTLFIQSKSIDDKHFPTYNNTVRMKEMEAKWNIRYIDGNHTRIVYQFRSDPGGLIPETQIGRFAEDLPAKTLIGLSKMITLPRYIQMAKTSEECRIVDKFTTTN